MTEPDIEEIHIIENGFDETSSSSTNEENKSIEAAKKKEKNQGMVNSALIKEKCVMKKCMQVSDEIKGTYSGITVEILSDEEREVNEIISVDDEVVALEVIKKDLTFSSHPSKISSAHKRRRLDIHEENIKPDPEEPHLNEPKVLSSIENSEIIGTSTGGINNTSECSTASSADEENKKTCDAELYSYQIQCVNLHCKSGYGLAEAPVFVLTYFGAEHKKNVLQKVCEDCFQIALKHQEDLAFRLTNHIPLFEAEFPKEREVVVVMDHFEERKDEENLPQNVIDQVEEHLMDVIKEALETYDLRFQWQRAENILTNKLQELSGMNDQINRIFSSMEKALRQARLCIYKDFTPRVVEIPELDIDIEPDNDLDELNLASSTANTIHEEVQNLSQSPNTHENDNSSHDIVSVEEVEIPQNDLPPVGNLQYPKPKTGDTVYVMKSTYTGQWVKGKIYDVIQDPDVSARYRVIYDSMHRGGSTKCVSARHIAYPEPSLVRYPVGTRIIALFKDTNAPAKEAYYVGIVAEPPRHINNFRYLVFFDDGYAQYVPHEKILLVCENFRCVFEDIAIENRDFIRKYLERYPERPMVKLQKGQLVRTEWNGKWWITRVLQIVGSLAKLVFEVNGRMEWIYRGSTRLGPLYSEFVAAAARKDKGRLSRHRSLGIASLKKKNMPYVEYSVDQDDAKVPSSIAGTSKNVAKKSTASKSCGQDSSSARNKGPPKPNEVMEYTTKGYIRYIDISSRKCSRVFSPHQCGPSCIDRTGTPKSNKGINPLVIPILQGFERQVIRGKGKRAVMYRAPCGRRLRNMIEIHRYLRITKMMMGLDLFDFDPQVHILHEFFLEYDTYVTYLTDISYGRENNVISCVNEINHLWPSYMEYSTIRIPQGGVNICLDEEFLVCCDCIDDCLDREKCECWQLTIEGARLAEGDVDSSLGYQFKRLLEPVTTGIYECNQRCKCSSTCLNRVAQLPLQLNLQVFRTLKKGWGLRALNDIPQGGFICIYAGLLHTEQSANDGGRMYGDEYLAELDYIEVVERFKEGYESDVSEGGEDSDEETVAEDDGEIKKKPSKFTAAVPVGKDEPKNYKSVREMLGDGADDCYIMDAKSSGNIGRYLNHSCQPNVFVQNVFVDTHDVRFPWVAFFALTHIKAGTELTWDYNYDIGSVPNKVLYCYCNNADCRGRLL